MPRTKAFNTEQALDRALHLFWRQGYDNTSMQDLVEAMGINRGSLYDTFGGKHALYVQAIEKYLSSYSLRDVRHALEGNDVDPRLVITELLYRMAREAAGSEKSKGCLLTNTIVEIGTRDAEIAERTKTAIENMVFLFCGLIEIGQRQGQFKIEQDAGTTALLLVNTMQGLRVLSKIYDDGARLTDMVDAVISSITIDKTLN